MMIPIRTLITCCTLMLTSTLAFSQVVGGMDFKLEEMFLNEKYEDLAFKGERMLDKDKFKRDPEITLYVSMAWYEISQSNDPQLQEEYSNALRDALKYAYKFARYDKEGLMAEDNDEYFDDLAAAGIADAEQWITDDRKRRNAVRTYKYMVKAMPNDHNILFFKGVLEHMNRNTGQAERDIPEAMTALIAKYEDPNYRASKVTGPLLEDGLIRWADIMVEQNYKDSAQKTIDWAIKFFPESETVAKKAESLK